MSKDVIFDRYARLYEIPYQLACLGHEVRGYCLSYQGAEQGSWQHEAPPGKLHWESRSVDQPNLLNVLRYPFQLLRDLKAFQPDIIIGASDIPHVVLGEWLARRLGRPFVADLYDNFEGFGQARIPGFVRALRGAVRRADLVFTTSEPLQDMVEKRYRTAGRVIAMPSTVDTTVFKLGSKRLAREALGLPAEALLIGTAGGLYREKGIAPVYAAWHHICQTRPDVHLVLAGPADKRLPPPLGDRVHLLGNLPHAQVAILFQALDLGIISVLDTPFGRYCFPQKAYEMLACGLPVVSSSVGEMQNLFAETPQVLFSPNDAMSLASALDRQLAHAVFPNVNILDWSDLIGKIEPFLVNLVSEYLGGN